MKIGLIILEFKIAIRYLFNRTEEGFISLISLFSFFGIFLGVATLIIVLSVMNGFRDKLISGILGVSGHIKVTSVSTGGGEKNQIYDFEKLIEKIKEFQDSEAMKILEKKFDVQIDSISPEITGQALMSFEKEAGKGVQGIYVLGLKSIHEKKKISDSILIGGDFDFLGSQEDKEKILIGTRIAENFRIQIGDRLNLISPSSESLIIGEIPNSKEFQIGGIFETKIFDVDNGLIYMDLDFARYFFDLEENSVSSLEIRVSNPANSLILKNELKKFIQESNYESQNNLIFSDWSETNGSYINALEIEKKVMFLILSFIIFIAVFNLISCLVMLVNEKTRSIAILKTMGMSSASILRIFLYCGLLISFCGVFLGAAFGIFFALKLNHIKDFFEYNLGIEVFNPIIYFFKDIPALINFSDVFFVIFFTILISIFAVIPPSLKASRKDPASILKYF